MTAKDLIPAAAFLAIAIGACSPGDAPDAAPPEAPETAAMEMEADANCFLRGDPAEAAERASPPDSASVTLGGDEVKVCYGAPSMNDRVIMGELVPYGEAWRLGANEATVVHLPFAAEIGGVAVEPGSYSLYAVPSPDSWEIVVNREAERWGIPVNDEVRAADVGSTSVSPEAIDDPVERMILRFDRVSDTEAHLILEWENTRVRVPVVRTG